MMQHLNAYKDILVFTIGLACFQTTSRSPGHDDNPKCTFGTLGGRHLVLHQQVNKLVPVASIVEEVEYRVRVVPLLR